MKFLTNSLYSIRNNNSFHSEILIVKKIIFTFFLISLFSVLILPSCASKVPVLGYSESIIDNLKTRKTPLKDYSDTENVNGFLPNEIYIKTPTQTFCTNYAFCIIDGRIYAKNLVEGKDVPKLDQQLDKKKLSQKKASGTTPDELNGWYLLSGTGLPNSTKTGFSAPSRIVEISADDDSLMAFSDEGRMYQTYFTKSIIQQAGIWEDTFGWPEKLPLLQNYLVKDKRGWAVATRRSKVLWYEDIYGNQHHYGTMGLDTLYFLSANGQEIRFTDSGLPAEFSHSLLGPERGSFISRNISVSASTMFLINDTGEMYTRLADFDTIGCDPMFFKYTYKKFEALYPGDNYRSNYEEWALPSEDWKKQPLIELTGKARLTKFITIIQNGYGNFARELRVAGLSDKGKTGYYFKQLNDSTWQFAEAPLILPESAFLDELLLTDKQEYDETQVQGLRGPKQEISYDGFLWENNIRNPSLYFSVKNFPMSEGSCNLDITYNEETKTILLYPVEMWTHMYRDNPGYDGTTKNFFITYSLPIDLFSDISPEFSTLLHRLFQGKDLTLFSTKLKATKDYFLLTDKDSTGKDITLLLTSDGTKNIENLMLTFINQYAYPEFNDYLTATLSSDRTVYTIKDRSYIQRVINQNNYFIKQLNEELSTYNAYKKDATVSRWGYNAFDLVTKVTLLNQIDFPKIKTMTSYGSDLMNTAADGWLTVADIYTWSYSHVIELLSARVAAYQSLIDRFDNNYLTATIEKPIFNTYYEYFDYLGIPDKLSGNTNKLNNYPIIARRMEDVPLFPGLVLEMNAGSTNTSFLIEFQNLAAIVAERKSDDFSSEPFETTGIIHIIYDTTEKDAVTKLDGKKVKIKWDGEQLVIKSGFSLLNHNKLFKN